MDLFSINIFAVGPTAQYAADAKYREKRVRKKVMSSTSSRAVFHNSNERTICVYKDVESSWLWTAQTLGLSKWPRSIASSANFYHCSRCRRSMEWFQPLAKTRCIRSSSLVQEKAHAHLRPGCRTSEGVLVVCKFKSYICSPLESLCSDSLKITVSDTYRWCSVFASGKHKFRSTVNFERVSAV